MAFRVRKAHVDDFDDIAEMDKVCFPYDDSMALESYEWWVCGPGPVAYAACCKSTVEEGAIYFARVGVLPEHRGNGLYRRLLKTIERYAAKHGYHTVLTDTNGAVSANNLIRCGYLMYEPDAPWALSNSTYWRRSLLKGD